MNGADLLDAAYGALIPDIAGLDETAGWQLTGCSGWVVRDLVFHLLSDARRGLVALHTSTAERADVDAVTYWRDWQPESAGEDIGRRATRVEASVWPHFRPLANIYVETSHAMLVAARERHEDDLLETQGHVLTASDLCSTLAVEATLHHLDLRVGVASREGLTETRRVLDGLLGRELAVSDDVRYALIGTGRELPSEAERAALGADVERLPLFG